MALVVAAAATAVVPPVVLAPAAQAAACTSGQGVTVVVDFGSLGGGVQVACETDGGGRTASRLFPDAGHPLTYAQRQPGFVCRVSGVPASDPCVNTSPEDAYWGLWWSDGESGSWTYSSFGAGSLEVPDGGSVAFAWDDQPGQPRPGATPPVHRASSPEPSSGSSAGSGPGPRPSSRPTSRPSSDPGGPGTAPATPGAPASTAGDAPSAAASTPGAPGRRKKPGASPTARPTATTSPTATATGSAEPSDGSSSPSATDGPVDADPAAAASDDGGLPL